GSSGSADRSLAGVTHWGRTDHGPDRRLVAHVELHLALEVQLALHDGAGPDHDARVAGRPEPTLGLRPAHENTALHMRSPFHIDIPSDGLDTPGNVRAVEPDRAVHVRDAAVDFSAVSERE